jgi:hypothetical protein
LFPASRPLLAPPRQRGALPILAASLPALALCLCVWQLQRGGFEIPHLAAQPIAPLLGLSLAVAAAYVVLGSFPLLACADLYRPATWRGALLSWRGVAVLAFVLAIKWLHSALSNGAECYGPQRMLPLVCYLSIAKPGIFLVSHAVFYGPVVLLAIHRWSAMCALIRQHGVGLSLTACFGVLLGLDSESRHLLNFLPLFVPFIVKVCDQEAWALGWGLAVASLVMSKVWLPILVGPGMPTPLTFPDQTLFMNLGPWMSVSMYLAQGTAVLAMAAWLWRRKSIAS